LPSWTEQDAGPAETDSNSSILPDADSAAEPVIVGGRDQRVALEGDGAGAIRAAASVADPIL
jgi:hypothetical protein